MHNGSKILHKKSQVISTKNEGVTAIFPNFGKIKKMFHGENLNFPSRLETKLVNSNSQMFKFPWNVSLPSSPLGKLGYSWGKLEKSGLNFIASELNTCAVLSSNSLIILKNSHFLPVIKKYIVILDNWIQKRGYFVQKVKKKLMIFQFKMRKYEEVK